MSSSTGAVERSDVAVPVTSRSVAVLRAAALFAIGMVITFSATLHERLAFDVAVVAASLAVIGVVHGIEWIQRRQTSGALVALALAIVSLVAAIAVAVLQSEIALVVVIATWGLVSATLEFAGKNAAPGTRPDAVIIGVISILLSGLVLLVRDDVVSVIGFFGGYAIVAGVFLGIAAFDSRRGKDTTAQVAPVMKVESE